MRTLELNQEFNLLGQIDLNNVKIALDRDEMEETVGGYHRPGGGGGWRCWSGFGLLVVVGVVAGAAIVSSGGTAAALLATGGGKLGAATLTAGGLSLLDYC
jgi:hypothetical protein